MKVVVCTKLVIDPDALNSYALSGHLEVSETGRGFRLQRLMLGMIAAQQPRTAGAHGHAAGDGVGRGAP